MLEPLEIPDPQPAHQVPGYQMPSDQANLLSWAFVSERMSAARFYWLSTTFADGRPHAVPVGGVWYKDRVHFDGSPQTGWGRNLIRDQRIAVHPPDPDRVVVIEGNAYRIGDDDIDEAEWETLDTAYQTKYAVAEGSPWWFVRPTKVIAWDGADLKSMTRWRFAPPSPSTD